MSRTVAVTAVRKFLEHGVRMGLAVTRYTWWYGFVLIPMAISAGKIVVFGRVCLKQGPSFLMTCRAVMRWGLANVSNFKRHMNRMAGEAGLEFHILCVLFVTHHTLRDHSVCCMAFAASHVRMGTGVVLHLFTLLLVTCETRSGNVTF